jgi:hypothetical protein
MANGEEIIEEGTYKYLEIGVSRIEEGTYKYLEIGASKTQVIKAIQSQGVDYIDPRPKQTIKVTRDNIEQLTLLRGKPGIIINDNKGLFIRLAFRDQKIEDVSMSDPTPDDVKRSFFVGQSELNAFAVIHSVVENIPKIEVFNYLPNARWTRITDITSEEIQYLKNYSVWSFSDREYLTSHYVLEFSVIT